MRGKATQGRKHSPAERLMKGKYVALKRIAEDRKKFIAEIERAGSHTPASQQIT